MTALHRVNTTVYDTWGGHVITVVIRRGPSQRGDSGGYLNFYGGAHL